MVQDIASVATAVGVLIAVVGLRQARKQRLRQFEGFYVERYWKLMDQLSVAVLRGRGKGSSSDDDEKIVRAYLLLCEDELDLRADGWISDATWRIWGKEIRAQIEHWPFREIWNSIKEESPEQSEPGFHRLREFTAPPEERGHCKLWEQLGPGSRFLHHFIVKLEEDDPCSVSFWRRWVRGLNGKASV